MMLILEEACPRCYGNLIMSDNSYGLCCEDCDAETPNPTKENLAYLLYNRYKLIPNRSDTIGSMWKMLKIRAEEFGPIEDRRDLTLAGKGLLISFRAGEIPAGAQCDEIDDALLASRGMIKDKDILKHLEEEGFLRK